MSERPKLKGPQQGSNVRYWVCADDGQLRVKHQIRVVAQTIDFDNRSSDTPQQREERLKIVSRMHPAFTILNLEF